MFGFIFVIGNLSLFIMFFLQLIGDYLFVMGIVFMLINECGYVVVINVLLVNLNESSDGRERVGFLQKEILEFFCLNDCVFNGDCVNGFCVCYKDYIVEDCFIFFY